MKTPLFESHVALGARMVPFAGWDMPIQYAGILAEHHHTRTACSVFDTCHMGEFELEGPSALSDLERLITCSVRTLRAGQCRYGYLLRDDGGVLDDLTCYRLAEDRFWLIVNAGTREGDREWVRGHLSAGTVFRDLSDETAKLDVQGPLARAAMERALGGPPPDLGYFRFARATLAGVDALVSRTGYTGEWGYELYFPASEAVRLWNLLLSDAAIRPAGLGARDTLRLEMGYPLYGHELSADRTPVGCARGQFLDMTKDFVGRTECARVIEEGCPGYLAGLRLDARRAARAGDPVTSNGGVVGEVTSGSFAPSLGVAVAMAYIDDALTAPGTRLEVGPASRSLPAEVVPLPFYRSGTARAKAPSS